MLDTSCCSNAFILHPCIHWYHKKNPVSAFCHPSSISQVFGTIQVLLPVIIGQKSTKLCEQLSFSAHKIVLDAFPPDNASVEAKAKVDTNMQGEEDGVSKDVN